MNELATASCDRMIDLIVDAVAEQDESAASAPARARSVMDSVESIRGDAVSRGYWRQLHSLANDPKFARAVERRISGGRPVLVPAEEDDRSRELAQGLEASGVSVASFFANQVLYLGPLRQDPQILYVAAPAEQSGYVGKKGEYAIAVLHKDAERSVWCPLSDGGVQHVPLRQAVNHWLETFGLADSIDTIYRPRLGLEPQIEVSDVARPLDMTAVGVGVSQLLPVLVMGLHSEPGALLIFEQPELHLHPAMQQILADFLIACVRSGRQVLVETHSDHFVTRLRRRIAEDERDQTVDLIGLVFTERIDGSTRFRRLDTNRYGCMEEWPEGFFDQGPRDSQELLRAGMQKRKKNRAR
jgi:predicted ATPase